MSIDTDQTTLDRWLADRKWVEFGGVCSICGDDCACGGLGRLDPPADWEADQKCEHPNASQPYWGGGNYGDHGTQRCPDCKAWKDAYTDWQDGKRRHPVTVPCPRCEGRKTVQTYDSDLGHLTQPCPDCQADPSKYEWSGATGRITVAWATVKWGPAIVVAKPSDSPTKQCVTILPRGIIGHWPRDGRPIEVPPMDLYVDAWTPDIDPQSLVGQWARGGTIEAAS